MGVTTEYWRALRYTPNPQYVFDIKANGHYRYSISSISFQLLRIHNQFLQHEGTSVQPRIRWSTFFYWTNPNFCFPQGAFIVFCLSVALVSAASVSKGAEKKAADSTADKKQDKRGLIDFGYGYGHGGILEHSGLELGHGIGYGHGIGLGHEVHVTKTVGLPYPVPVEKPVPVVVERKVPVVVEKHVPIHIDRPVPYPVKVPVKVPVIQKVGIPIPKPYPVEVPKPYPVHVSHPVIVEKQVPVLLKSHDYGIPSIGLDFHGLGHGFGHGHYHH